MPDTLPWEDEPRSVATHSHSGLCCFTSISGPDGERAYGCEPLAVVGYGSRLWPSFGLWLVPQPNGGDSPSVC